MICPPCRQAAIEMAAGNGVTADSLHAQCPEFARQSTGLPGYVSAGSARCDCQHDLQSALARKDG